MAAQMFRPKDIMSSPYFVHPGENPSLILVSNLLDGSNYHSWFRSMRMALISKNKFKFVDGSIVIPQADDDTFAVWERCNTLVMSWLYRSLTQTIADSISCLDTAYEIWKDLKDRFSQGDSGRIGDIQEEIYSFKQGSMSITKYFTHLKTLWDELLNLRSIPICHCEPKCPRGISETIKMIQSSDQVIKFLKGLNENFSPVRTQIIMQEPLPAINKAFSMVIQYERQLATANKAGGDSNVFMAKGSNESDYDIDYESNICYARGRGMGNFRGNFQRRGGFNNFYQGTKQKLCSYCGNSGHTVDYCYRKHGFPPGFQPKKPDNAYANHAQSEQQDFQDYDDDISIMQRGNYKQEVTKVNMNTESTAISGVHTGHTFTFTPEQYQKIMSLIQPGPNEAGPSQVNSLVASFKPPEDKQVNHVNVRFPNGSLIPVTHIGSVQLSDELLLHNVLYVPMFNFNLISDMDTWKRIGSAEKKEPSSQLRSTTRADRHRVDQKQGHGISIVHLNRRQTINTSFPDRQKSDKGLKRLMSISRDTYTGDESDPPSKSEPVPKLGVMAPHHFVISHPSPSQNLSIVLAKVPCHHAL
ncbi:uncharacterized protein LOC130015244 [Mercurialis annua]|uniref:uncharacterized protein LOC130015244 n=1 Tax=Mercurialis annua TaxID=3986 RepID=UPI0024ADE556|nr:uncharacterized protein LOC130015244 [Mercurialis annua]